MFQEYRQQVLDNIRKNPKYDVDLFCQIINANHQGCRDATTTIQKISMPFMFSKRVLINTYYPKLDQQTGSISSLSSSILNEQIRDEHMQEKNAPGDAF